MESKTILEWFEQAKVDGYEWADAAIQNCKKYPYHSSDEPIEPVYSLSESILNGFLWIATDEGDSYWDKIHDSLIYKGL